GGRRPPTGNGKNWRVDVEQDPERTSDHCQKPCQAEARLLEKPANRGDRVPRSHDRFSLQLLRRQRRQSQTEHAVATSVLDGSKKETPVKLPSWPLVLELPGCSRAERTFPKRRHRCARLHAWIVHASGSCATRGFGFRRLPGLSEMI